MIELGIGHWELGMGHWELGIVILLLLLRSQYCSDKQGRQNSTPASISPPAQEQACLNQEIPKPTQYCLRFSTSSPVPSVKFRLTQMPQNFLSDEDLVFLAISAKTRPTQS